MKKIAALALTAALAGGCMGLAGCAHQEEPMPDTGSESPIEQPSVDEEDAMGGETVLPDPGSQIGVATVEAPVEQATAEALQEPSESKQPVHEHVWVRDYTLEEVPAETKTVHHDAVTQTTVEDHTVCNVCLQPIDGQVEEHEAATGHHGATPNTPIKMTKIVKEAYDETIVVSEAKAQLVSRTETCSTCGVHRDVEVKVQDADAGETAVAADTK